MAILSDILRGIFRDILLDVWQTLEEEPGGDPLNDYMAVISLGVYPTPTPTDAERAYYAATYGLRHTL